MATVTRRTLVREEDVTIGLYLATQRLLYYVVDIRVRERDGKSYRIAMLENCLTGNINPFHLKELAGMRIVSADG